MRLTIIPSDSAVYKDGIVRELDLSTCGIPENVHALQWYDTFGEIEFSSNPGQPKPANETISELPAWANNCVAVWDAWTPPAPPPDQPVVEGAQTL